MGGDAPDRSPPLFFLAGARLRPNDVALAIQAQQSTLSVLYNSTNQQKTIKQNRFKACLP